jgi:hypothetical protein
MPGVKEKELIIKKSKTMKTKYIAVIIWAVFMSVLLFMLGCSKDEPIEPISEPITIIHDTIIPDTITIIPDTTMPKYKVNYYVRSDSAAIRANFDSVFIIQYVKNYDTTFYTDGGEVMLIVTCFQQPMMAGLIVNSDTIESCVNLDFFEIHYKLN